MQMGVVFSLILCVLICKNTKKLFNAQMDVKEFGELLNSLKL